MNYALRFTLAIACVATAWWYAADVASHGYIGLHRGPTDDFYSFWNPSRALLEGADPYSTAVAEQTQKATYGALARDIGLTNNLRLAYPVAGMFPLLLLGWLPFRIADTLMFLLSSALVTFSTPWIRGKWDRDSLLGAALAFASYPIIVAIEMRQPTLFYFGLIAGSFALARSRRFGLAGVAAALAVGKPQVAAPVLLPMLFWTLADWRNRKRFMVTFAASTLMLFAASFWLSPSWLQLWIASLREYVGYVHPSLLVGIFGPKAGCAISSVLLIALCVALWLRRESDLWLLAALSVTIFILVIQAEPYNLVLLLFPVLWAVDNAPRDLPKSMLNLCLVLVWLGNVIGLVLLHENPHGGLGIGMVTAYPIIIPLLIMAVCYCVNPELLQAWDNTAAGP